MDICAIKNMEHFVNLKGISYEVPNTKWIFLTIVYFFQIYMQVYSYSVDAKIKLVNYSIASKSRQLLLRWLIVQSMYKNIIYLTRFRQFQIKSNGDVLSLMFTKQKNVIEDNRHLRKILNAIKDTKRMINQNSCLIKKILNIGYEH